MQRSQCSGSGRLNHKDYSNKRLCFTLYTRTLEYAAYYICSLHDTVLSHSAESNRAELNGTHMTHSLTHTGQPTGVRICFAVVWLRGLLWCASARL
jgi:hypothetical protein